MGRPVLQGKEQIMQIIQCEVLGAAVTGYLHTHHDRLIAHVKRPALIICPGGGYFFTSPREADPPALAFAAQGYNVFILDYACNEQAKDGLPLRQLAETVRLVRERAEEWNLEPDKIAVMGFSAGGHLAASLGAFWNAPDIRLPAGCRPDALLLCYPVITLLEHTHAGTSDNVSGGREEERLRLSVELGVTKDFPPAFIWHTVDDDSVPVENSLLLVQALQREKVPFECHLFAHGHHGISVCTQEVETPNPECAPWVGLCQTWLNKQFNYVP